MIRRSRSAKERRISSKGVGSLLNMSRIAPMAMIFIPCRGGVSHRPDEYASPAAIAAGTAVLADVLEHLAK